jgi:thioester reductase-like protein
VTERFLVTGAHGCIGAWTIAELVRGGTEVVALDLTPGHGRAALLLDDAELARVRFVRGDVADPESLATAFTGVTHVVHLAALQFPYCRNDHVEGARVNVLGTVCVFDAAVTVGAKLVYSSSIAGSRRRAAVRHVDRAARAVSDGAPVYDAGGAEHDMRDVIDAIEAAAPDARDQLRGHAVRRDAIGLRRQRARGGARRYRVAAARPRRPRDR